jgi:hypothetical protein
MMSCAAGRIRRLTGGVRLGLAAGLLLPFAPSLAAAEYQWSALMSPATPNVGQSPRAFLWIPPDCRRVRAVVVGQNNMIEEGILQHPLFRREMASLGIAEIFIAPPFDTFQSATNNDAAQASFNAMLKSLAADSGYGELEFAPVVPLGHSAMASYPWNFAAWNPERTLAILSVHGDAPQTTLTGNGRPNLDWGGRNIDGIPGVMVMGEYEWWEDRLAPAQKFRAQFPAAPVALLAEPGRGHFDFSDDLVGYLAQFIRAAAAARLPADQPAPVPVKLKPVDPRAGWLVDRWRKNEPAHAAAAPFAKFKGEPGEAFWAMNRTMARLTEKFNARQRGGQPQMLGLVQDGRVVPQTPGTHEQVRLKFEPLADGLTFKLTAVFLDAVAAGKNPATWTGLTNGAPLGHTTGGGPVKVSRITGPVEQLNADTFAVRFNRATVSSDRRAGDIWLLAEQPGDAQYKSAVQQALLKIPMQLKDGAEQHLTFPEIADVKRGTKSVALQATSDAGVPVCYYVREGPAEMDGNILKFTTLPPRAKFPVKVTVVAWQYGRATEPKLKSAEPVTREFMIRK